MQGVLAAVLILLPRHVPSNLPVLMFRASGQGEREARGSDVGLGGVDAGIRAPIHTATA